MSATLSLPSPPSVYAAAAERLGRPLTTGELAIDVEQADRDLTEGKARLAAAIEAEKRRVVHAIVVRGVVARINLTAPMVEALDWLYRRGRDHALAEMGRLGVDPRRRRYAASERRYAVRSGGTIFTRPKIVFLSDRLRGMLGGIQVRVDGEVADAGAAGISDSLIARELDRRIPGALDAASRLVSSGFNAGVSDVYADHADLFAGWQYTAIMDSATCEECAAHDGETYETIEELYAVLPDFGPNPSCYGDGRCRCRGVPLGPSDAGVGLGEPPAGSGFSADIGVTPFRADEDNVIGFYDSAKFAQFERDIGAAADRYGVTVDGLDRVEGVWEGDLEPSVSIRAHDGEAGVRGLAADLGRGYNQDGVLLFSPSAGEDMMVTFDPVEERAAIDAMREVGLPGGRFTADGRLQIVGSGRDFSAKIRRLGERLNSEYEVEAGRFDLLERDSYDQAVRRAEKVSPRPALPPGGTREGGVGVPAPRPLAGGREAGAAKEVDPVELARVGQQIRDLFEAPIESLAERVGGRVVELPPRSAREVAERLAAIERWTPLARGEPLSDLVERIEVEVPEAEKKTLSDGLKDLVLSSEFVLGEIPSENGIGLRLVLRRQGTRLHLTVDVQNQVIANVEDIQRAHEIALVQQQSSGPQPIPAAVPDLTLLLSEPSQVSDLVYLALPVPPPDGPPAGLIRMYQRSGKLVVERAAPGGGWLPGPIPRAVLAQAHFIPRERAVHVYDAIRRVP